MEKIIELDGVRYLEAGEVASLICMGSKSFSIELADKVACEGFFVREEDGTLRAYKNSCPHTGAPLNWTPNQFLTTSGRYIQCSIHGAMFKTDTGECFAGPCAGKFLKALKLLERDGMAYVALPEIQKSPLK